MKYYMVIIDPNELSVSYMVDEKLCEMFGDAQESNFEFMKNHYLVNTRDQEMTAEEIADELLPYMAPEQDLFIYNILDFSDQAGQMTKEFWDYLRENRIDGYDVYKIHETI